MKQPIHDQKKANRTAIIFIIKLLFFYLLFSQGNLFMNSVLNETGRYYNQFFAEHFNYIKWVRLALIEPSAWIIRQFGFYTVHNDIDLMVVDGPHLRVNYACLGLGVMSFFTAFVIAFPAKVKSKFKLLVIGAIMIYLLNVLRIAGLAILLGIFKSQRENFTYHHEIFNAIVYLCIFILLYYWIKRNNSLIVKKDKNPKSE